MSFNLLNLSTELLIHIFAYLPVADLFSVQSTCHRAYDIVAGTAYIQYILHTQLNGVDDLLPPNCPFSERLELLRHHVKTWSDLQLNLYTKFSMNVQPCLHRNIIQDGYLISISSIDPTRYRYVDLFSSPPGEEPHWVNISLKDFPAPYSLVFSVDHDLAVAVREMGMSNGLARQQLAFFEFTTSAPHPLSAAHTINIPLVDYLGSIRVEVEVLGDYVLATAVHKHSRSSFYLVSWKTGTVTFLRVLPGTPKLTVIDSNLVMLIRDSINSLEINKLDLASSHPRMQTVCSLELPPLRSDVCISHSMFVKEWIASSERHVQSQFSQRRLLPFCSSRNDTIALRLSYRIPARDTTSSECAMLFNTTALLSVVHSGVRKVSWKNWGPIGTRVLRHRGIMPVPAGPFWITSVSPLTVCDYDHLRAAHVQSTGENPSSSPSRLPVFTPTKVVGKHWASGQVETRMPYREFVSRDINILHPVQIVGEREWIVVISATATAEGTSFTVYHVG